MPSNAIEVRFVAAGLNDLDRAFRSVEDRAVGLGRTNQKIYDNDARAAQRAAREKEREQARSDRERERSAAAHEREQIKLTEKSVAAVAKAQADKLKIEDRFAKESLNFAHATSLAKQRIIERELETEKRLRERHARALGTLVHTSVGSALSRSTGMMAHGATALAGTALSLGGGLSIQGILEQRKQLETASAYLSNQSSVTGANGVTSRVSTQQIMAQAKALGIARNINPTEIVEGMNAYFAKTGDMAGTMKNAQLFADLHTATNADMGQIASVAGALKIQNPKLDDKAMRAMMLNTIGQTRTGAVDIVDLAKYVPAITSGSALYGGDQDENQRKLIGLSQVAIRTAGTNANAARSVRGLGVDLASHADKLHAELGVNVKDKNGMLRAPAEVISELMLASGGDIGKLKHAGIGAPAMNLFTSERGVFNDAGGGKAGAAAILGDLKRFEKGGYSEETLQSDISNVMNTTGAKFDTAMAHLRETIEEKLTPYLEKFAEKLPELEPKVEKFVGAIADAADFLTSHPWTGIFAIMSASIAGEMAKAAIGKAVTTGLENAFAAASNKGVNLGGAVSLAALGAVAITAEQAWIQASIDKDHEAAGARGALQGTAASKIQALMANPTTENIAAAQQIRAQLITAEGHIGDKSAFGQIAGMFQSGDDAKKEEAENKKLLASFMDSIGKLDVAIAKASKNIGGTGSSNGSPNTPSRNGPQTDPSRGGTK